MYDNETGEYFAMSEFDDGQWFTDEDGYLYINPAGPEQGEQYGYTEMLGPDNGTMLLLTDMARESESGFITDEQAEYLGLTPVPRHRRGFTAEDGYYYA